MATTTKKPKPEKPAPKVIDLMDALRKALANWDKPPSDVSR